MSDRTIATVPYSRLDLGKLLRRVKNAGQSEITQKRGSLRAVRDYFRRAVPEPEVLRIAGNESKRKGTDMLSSKQIDRIIKAARRSSD